MTTTYVSKYTPPREFHRCGYAGLHDLASLCAMEVISIALGKETPEDDLEEVDVWMTVLIQHLNDRNYDADPDMATRTALLWPLLPRLIGTKRPYLSWRRTFARKALGRDELSLLESNALSHDEHTPGSSFIGHPAYLLRSESNFVNLTWSKVFDFAKEMTEKYWADSFRHVPQTDWTKGQYDRIVKYYEDHPE